MTLVSLGRLAGTLMLAGAVAGCVDAAVEVELMGPETAQVVVTQAMNADFYGMLKTEADGDSDHARRFCVDGELTEKRDGSATCTITAEGTLRQLPRAGQPVRFTPEEDGLVRVELALEEVRDEIGAGDTDEDGRRMLEAFFSGRKLTVSFFGGVIADTNMDVSADGQAATAVLPLLDVVNETGDWPDVLYAVVEAP
ncbi:hypothetical protein ACFSX5_10305 [Devosia albogilva]|uniref:Lipoprotein n=1 Tax=Devosia albogilva TaxID=429726 RepID=A0ABW5QKA1_9HYPH